MTTQSSTIASAIALLEEQLHAVDQKRAQLAAAIEGLRMVATAGEPARPPAPRPPSPASRRTNRGLASEEKVLLALNNGPRSPKAIVEATEINEKSLQHILRRLLASNQVTKTGKTWNTVYQLTT